MQSPAFGSPQLIGGGSTHISCADQAQLVSQLDSQQNESIAHTNPQHSESAQEALICGIKHDPNPGMPQI
jgi:hypothetical protein